MDERHVSSDRQLTTNTPAAARALLVIADDLYARTVGRWLSTRGWQVTRAADASQGLASWKASDAQAVLIDLDDDDLGALLLMAAAKHQGLTARAVVCTRDPEAAALPAATKERLGIEDIKVRPCHIGEVGAALARAARQGEGEPLGVAS